MGVACPSQMPNAELDIHSQRPSFLEGSGESAGLTLDTSAEPARTRCRKPTDPVGEGPGEATADAAGVRSIGRYRPSEEVASGGPGRGPRGKNVSTDEAVNPHSKPETGDLTKPHC